MSQATPSQIFVIEQNTTERVLIGNGDAHMRSDGYTGTSERSAVDSEVLRVIDVPCVDGMTEHSMWPHGK